MVVLTLTLANSPRALKHLYDLVALDLLGTVYSRETARAFVIYPEHVQSSNQLNKPAVFLAVLWGLVGGTTQRKNG
jgi:hypothetical protein